MVGCFYYSSLRCTKKKVCFFSIKEKTENKREMRSPGVIQTAPEQIFKVYLALNMIYWSNPLPSSSRFFQKLALGVEHACWNLTRNFDSERAAEVVTMRLSAAELSSHNQQHSRHSSPGKPGSRAAKITGLVSVLVCKWKLTPSVMSPWRELLTCNVMHELTNGSWIYTNVMLLAAFINWLHLKWYCFIKIWHAYTRTHTPAKSL